MEMYDTVFFNSECWSCKRPIHTWQSKSGTCLKLELDAIDLMRESDLSQIEIHIECNHCNKWNSKVIKRQDALENKRNNTHWNYRLVYRVFCSGKEEVAIHEVYYENGQPISCTVDPVCPHGENLDEFSQDFEHYKAAFFQPILKYDDFPGSDEFEEW
jgi:hypothetical protein